MKWGKKNLHFLIKFLSLVSSISFSGLISYCFHPALCRVRTCERLRAVQLVSQVGCVGYFLFWGWNLKRWLTDACVQFAYDYTFVLC